jgi:hypothetical protein
MIMGDDEWWSKEGRRIEGIKLLTEAVDMVLGDNYLHERGLGRQVINKRITQKCQKEGHFDLA